jgi:ATP/maltotriose-dependent transcriptional regulator MalT
VASRWALVERTAQVTELRSAVAALASRPAGRFLVIEGAAGIGKSRLMAETRGFAAEANLQVLSARGTELEREHAYGLVRQLFEPAVRSANGQAQASLLSGAAAAAATVVGQLASDRDTPGEHSVMHGLFWLTTNLCQRGPTVCLADDLHWADASSLRFLAYLLPRLEGLPLLVVGALRPGEPGAETRLLNMIVSDPAAAALRPAPLSRQAVAQLLGDALGRDAHPDFVAACHSATAGNPLMVRHIAATVLAEGLPTTAESASEVAAIGSRAVIRWVSNRLAAMPPDSARFARAASILDEGAQLRDVVAVAGLGFDTGGQALHELERAEILAPNGRDGQGGIGFVHPLVRQAVHESLSRAERAAGHNRAAQVLADKDAPPEQVAAHLMLTAPAGDPAVVHQLRTAASKAVARGAPESAFAYLRRCLSEPPTDDERPELLVEIGSAATLVDLEAAAGYLRQAHATTGDTRRRATIACMLGSVLLYSNRLDESLSVLSEVIDTLPASDVDLRRRVQAYILNMFIVEPRRQSIVHGLRHLWQLKPHHSVGGRLLDCVLAFHDMKACRPEAVERARRGLADGVLIDQAAGDAPIGSAWVVLLAADDESAMASIDASMARSRSRGAVRDLAPAYGFRALCWLRRGNLAEAETDAREAGRAVETARIDVGRQWIAPYLAEALLEQGRLDAAQAALDWAHVPDVVPLNGSSYLVLDARARLLRQRDRLEEALEAALTCGRFWTAAAGSNPAMLAWRSEVALCLHGLGRDAEARDYADEEVVLARQWGAPWALGHALRVSGLVRGGDEGLRQLTGASAVLGPSPARLEYAKTMVDLGMALRRAGRTVDARRWLRDGMELADSCGAAPVTKQARAELLASGVRLRKPTAYGPAALSPSERRVAELAAAGSSNREIAEALFVTTKTVEVHLTAVYRKLGTNRRTQLAAQLAAAGHTDQAG